MRESPNPSPQPEPGRIQRHKIDVDQAGWLHWLPGLYALRHYDAAWLRRDHEAGLVLTTVLVPVGIAYAVKPADHVNLQQVGP